MEIANRSTLFRHLLTLFLAIGMALVCETATGQDEADEEDFLLEDIVVTGSRVRGAESVGATVIQIGREEIELSAGVTVDRIIKELPQVFNLGVTESARNTSGGAGNIVFLNSVNLHGIGPYATLVLVDGHRVIYNTRSVDPSMLPSIGLERIEVIAVGASAVYGSDAIAGVVNLIPRRSLDGVDVSLRYGTGDNFDEYQIGAAFGNIWDSGQFMFAAERAYRSNVNGNDRDFYTSDQRSSGGDDYRVTRSSPGNIRVGDTTYAIPEGGVTQSTADQLVPGTVNLFDSVPGIDLLPQQEYISINTTFTQTITDRIELFADGFYSKREFERIFPYHSATMTVPSTNAFFVQPPGTTVDSYSIDYNFKNDLPRDVSIGSSENWEITPGLRITLPRDFQLEALYTYGESDDQALQSGGLDSRGPSSSLSVALASSDPATAFDPYGLYRTSAATLAAISDQIYDTPTLTTFNGYELRVNGPVIDLPGGTVKVAAGYEGQEIEVDPGIARGNPGRQVSYRSFSRDVDSVYVELLVPVVGGANAISGISRLEFTGAWRYDKYDDVGSTDNPKFGFNYSPVESLSFHGSYGTSFRAPLITEIYGNSDALYGEYYQNPEGGAPLLGFAWSGPNTGLEPEEATTWSFGGDFTPTENTKINLTYWEVEYEKQVTKYLGRLDVLSIEDQLAGTGLILHGTDAGNMVSSLVEQGIPVARGSFPGDDPANVTLYLDGRNRNLGVSITRGIDFQITHNWETDATGSFLFSLGGTYLTTYDVALSDAGEKVDFLNEIFNPLRFKARGSVTWNYRSFATQFGFRYVNGYDNTAVTPTQSVDSYIPVDIVVRYNADNADWLGEFGTGLSVSLEARNAFDADPPYVNIAQGANGGGGFDPTASDPVGRVIAVSLRKSF